MENMTETVKRLRALEKAAKEKRGWFVNDFRAAVLEAAPALLSRIEYLEKIAERVPEECCFTCGLLDFRCLQQIQPFCTDWRPFDGEKEG